jgi:hypothetical protein
MGRGHPRVDENEPSLTNDRRGIGGGIADSGVDSLGYAGTGRASVPGSSAAAPAFTAVCWAMAGDAFADSTKAITDVGIAVGRCQCCDPSSSLSPSPSSAAAKITPPRRPPRQSDSSRSPYHCLRWQRQAGVPPRSVHPECSNRRQDCNGTARRAIRQNLAAAWRAAN